MNADFNAQDPCYPVRVSVRNACLAKGSDRSYASLNVAEARELIRDLQEAIIRAETNRRLLADVAAEAKS